MNGSTMVRAAALLALVAAGSATAGHAQASAGGAYVDYAEVLSVEPIYTSVEVSTPVRECWDEEVPRYHHAGHGSYTPMILGGIIGGVVGNQFGSGRGKKLMTAAGVVLGGSVGRDVARRHGRHYTELVTETRCRVDYERHVEERVDGYRVEYLYQGRTYVTRTDHDPGDRIRVGVRVTPAE
ncbi:MAG: glycine zipper 2TM domain-containing protein [Gammaproteobacteria bacterium]|nr:glycine zipper 2TM domain-containing protein [Gammaproteobacteria bacterium]